MNGDNKIKGHQVTSSPIQQRLDAFSADMRLTWVDLESCGWSRISKFDSIWHAQKEPTHFQPAIAWYIQWGHQFCGWRPNVWSNIRLGNSYPNWFPSLSGNMDRSSHWIKRRPIPCTLICTFLPSPASVAVLAVRLARSVPGCSKNGDLNLTAPSLSF